MFQGAPIIDADAHKIENAVLFFEYVEPPFRDRIRMVTDHHGEQRMAITDRHPQTGKADFVRLYPQPEGFGKGAYRALAPETAMGALFNRIRIEDMDREGIDVQVIYGSLALTLASLIDQDLATALCRAYNNYIRDDCEPYRTRLAPVGVLPLQDIPEAVNELRRCVERLGMAAVTIAPNLPLPHPDAPEAFPRVRAPRHLSDPTFFPLYQAAEELNVPIAVHGTAGAYLCGGAADQLDTFTLVHVFGHRNQQQMALAKLIMNGVLEQFPNLRFGFLEGGCGWLPDLVHALRDHWERRVRNFAASPYQPPRVRFALESFRDRNRAPHVGLGRRVRNLLRLARATRRKSARHPGNSGEELREHRELTHSPEECLLRGQVFATFESQDPAPVYLPAALGTLGERLAGWSIQYGSWDGTLTDCVRRIAENPQINADYARRLLSTNALEFYGQRLRQRIEPHLQEHRLLLEAPLPPADERRQWTVEVRPDTTAAWSVNPPERVESPGPLSSAARESG